VTAHADRRRADPRVHRAVVLAQDDADRRGRDLHDRVARTVKPADGAPDPEFSLATKSAVVVALAV
jgi:hypothetical protein